MTIPANQIIHAELTVLGLMTAGGVSAVPTANVFHYRRTAVVIDPSKTSLEAEFQAECTPLILDMLNVRWTHTGNTVRWIDDALDAPVAFVHSDPALEAGDSLQSDQALFLLYRTAIRGRNYRGSKHFGPLSESDTTTNGDVINAGAITRANALAAALATPLTDGDGNVWNPCVLSRSLSQLTVNPTTVIANDVTQILVNKRIGNMKRRQVASSY